MERAINIVHEKKKEKKKRIGTTFPLSIMIVGIF